MRSRNPAPGERISATPLVPSATPSVPVHAPAIPIAEASVCCESTRLGAVPIEVGTRTTCKPPAAAATATYVLSCEFEIQARSRAYGVPHAVESGIAPRGVKVTAAGGPLETESR